MSEKAPAVQAFEDYCKQRFWHYARNTGHGISVNQTTLGMFCDFYIAGVSWGREHERKKNRAERGRKQAKPPTP